MQDRLRRQDRKEKNLKVYPAAVGDPAYLVNFFLFLYQYWSAGYVNLVYFSRGYFGFAFDLFGIFSVISRKILGLKVIQFLFFIVLLVLLTPLLGSYMSFVFQKQNFGYFEKGIYRLCSIQPEKEMTAIEYGKSLFFFNGLGFLTLFFLLLFQHLLPLNPQHFPGVQPDLAFNTAMSFVTNTNWQAYSGETTLSYLSQALGLTVQNFLSASTGMGAMLALIRGITRKTTDTVGNFWVDLVRAVVYIFLPLSILLSLILVYEGSVQTFSPYVEVITLENQKQKIPLGPVASQIAIKQLGTNGGGFFGANSAHPFENPSGLTDFFETLAILLVPAALTYTFGKMIKNIKHGWALFIVMFSLWGIGLGIAFVSEGYHNPLFDVLPVLEGKETRIGNSGSLLWTVSTTATANGSNNSMISSLSPLAGGVAMFNIMLGEIIFGGVGVGLCSMIMFILLTIFLSGLMVGRTPEYLGKKIEKEEMRWVMIAILMPSSLILIGAGISSVLPVALSSLGNQGPHGLSEILYAFSSSAGNNGSAFAGLSANTLYFNLFLGFIMMICRVSIIVPSLAIAHLLGKKKITPASSGTFSTNTPLFLMLLFSVILIVGALTFFPALSLGPIVEHFLMIEGRLF